MHSCWVWWMTIFITNWCCTVFSFFQLLCFFVFVTMATFAFDRRLEMDKVYEATQGFMGFWLCGVVNKAARGSIEKAWCINHCIFLEISNYYILCTMLLWHVRNLISSTWKYVDQIYKHEVVKVSRAEILTWRWLSNRVIDLILELLIGCCEYRGEYITLIVHLPV